MRKRNADTPISATAKKTPPPKKSAAKTPSNATVPPPESSATPNSKRASTPKAKQVKTNDTTTSPTPELKPQPAAEEAKASPDVVEVTLETKAVSTKPTRTVVKKTVIRKGTSNLEKAIALTSEDGKAKDHPPNPTVSLKSTETKCVSAPEDKQVKTNDTTTSPSLELKPVPAVDAAKASSDAVQVTLKAKAVSGTKPTRTVVKKTLIRRKTSTLARAIANVTPKSSESEKAKAQESSKKEEVKDAKDVESANKEESIIVNVEEFAQRKEITAENVEVSTKEDHGVGNVEEPRKQKEAVNDVQLLVENVEIYSKQEDPVVTDVVKYSENQEPMMAKEKDEAKEEKEETIIIEDKVEPNNEPVNMDKDINEELEVEDVAPEDVDYGDENMEQRGDKVSLEEFGEEELAEDNVVEHGEEADALEEERAELTAIAQERKIKKELEIFVGGLDRDAAEEDVKNVFENVGEVVDVRLHKDPSTNQNKGYAFVKFATKEQASRALAEMKNPVIHGKRCGTAPSEDNDTLFLGNICNSWTKEAIKKKLKDYGIESVENITLVPNAQHEGLSRGFAFIEFSCHADAMLAYKRLQKPDVIFGHSERTAKVAFAEPLREPDPEVMAQVKSVFVDGLPPHWDEDHVREQFKIYGEIERIMLARNMSTAKRKDFGFVDFTTHEAAVVCIDDINTRGLGDGNSKIKVRARLSNPLPKIQAVKGGMCGGFRIGRVGGGSFPKFGRGFGRGGNPFNRANFQRGRGFYQPGHGQTGRMSFTNQHDIGSPYPPFRDRQNFGQAGGRWGSFRGASDRGRGRYMPFRGQPFSPEEEFNRPFLGRHFDDPYLYEDSAHEMKRPFFTDQDPDYIERSRVRPRLDYSDSAVSRRGTYYRDTFGAGSDLYPRSRDYYGPDYGGGAYSSFYEGDRPYGSGYYY